MYKDLEKRKRYARNYWHTRKKTKAYMLKRQVSNYKRHAIEKGYNFSLSLNQFNTLLLGNCHYCNKSQAMGIDRRNNSLGYQISNVVSCCKVCNYMKNTLKYEEFIIHIVKIIEHLNN